jgi:hypothetical protein
MPKMKKRFTLCFLGASTALLLVLIGCSDRGAPKGPSVSVVATGAVTAAVGGPFQERLLEVARSYEEYGRRFDGPPNWGPVACAPTAPNPESAPPSPPPSPSPISARYSAGGDAGTHGRKLYWLFVKEKSAYPPQDQASPIGQVIVKEAWRPEEVAGTTAQAPIVRKVRVRQGDRVTEQTDSYLPYARRDGRLYHAAEKSGLFIMYKLDPKTPDTDAGWVYGTVTAHGKQVTSAGRVASCMACHQKAPHDRQFGLPKE